MSLWTPPPGAGAAALAALYPPVDPYIDDPVGFAADILGFHAWSKQRQVMEAVRDDDRIAVRACHGVGKTAVAARIALWFLGTHPDSRVITTAPTWRQVADLLWREIRGAVSHAHAAGKGTVFPKPSATKLDIGDEWFAIGLSTNEPERFQGHHADHILLIVDEASGVDEKIYEAAEGFLTAEGAKVLLLGNPTKVGGAFYQAFTKERETWNTIHISAFDSPNYTGEEVPPAVARSLPRKAWADEKAKQWGVESPMYEVRVLGDFPSNAENTVVPLYLVENAQAENLPVPFPAKLEDVVVACDVARFGDDETVIGTRHGQRIRIRHSYTGKPTTETTGRIIEVWNELVAESGAHPRIVIDDDGVGGGVTDQLREKGYNVTPFNGGARAIQPKKYPNARSEAWFRIARHLPELDLDPDDQLAADLVAPTYKLDSDGRRVVEPKKDTKKRLGRSPDRGDMVLLTLVPTLVVDVPDPRTQATAGPVRHDLGGWESGAPTGGSLTADLLNEDM